MTESSMKLYVRGQSNWSVVYFMHLRAFSLQDKLWSSKQSRLTLIDRYMASCAELLVHVWYLATIHVLDLASTIHVWRMGGSRGLLDKTLFYKKVMCLNYPEAAY